MNLELILAQHGFPPLLDSTTETLILGSFPSVKSREKAFYYMHPQNRFWSVLSEVLDEDFVHADRDTKVLLLKKHHIGLYDVIESCRIQGSQDASIQDVTISHIRTWISMYPIQKIFLNGATAYKHFIQEFPDLQSMATKLPSTSPANASWNLERLVEAWNIIKS